MESMNEVLYEMEVFFSEETGLGIQRKEWNVVEDEETIWIALERGKNSTHVNPTEVNVLHLHVGATDKIGRVWCDEEHMEHIVEQIKNEVKDEVQRQMEATQHQIQQAQKQLVYFEKMKKKIN